MTVATLRTEPLSAPDRDWEELRAATMTALRHTAPDWTDHNVSDPGVTIAEALAWGLADLHYRTQHVPLDGWSADTGLWRTEGTAHWSATPLPATHSRVLALAEALRGLTPAQVATARAATVPREAASALVAAGVPADVARAGARLLRAPYVLRAALDGGALVEEVREEEDTSAVGRLRLDPAFDLLWDEELVAVLRRARRRALARDIRRRTVELRRAVGSAADPVAAETAIGTLLGLAAGDPQRRDVLGIHPAPGGVRPEHWERPAGRTTLWPPHPLQARTVEPVTADDYARLARGATGVRRAWAVPGVLAGVGWDGHATAADPSRVGAITLLVEPHDTVFDGPPSDADREGFARAVLAEAVGIEGFEPLHLDLDAPMPRRVLCDEVGAAVLRQCAVTLRGVLHVAVTADREDVLAHALARVAELFRRGRPESAPDRAPVPDLPRDLDGPWPLPPPMPEGWTPGDPVRVTEIVQALSADPEVYGVEALQARAGGDWESYELVLDPSCVPVLAETQCVSVRLDLVEGCSGAC